MDTPCKACSSGPFGFAGHANLNVQSLGDARISLRCSRCDSLWSRTLEREGYFVWAALTEGMAGSPLMGIPVPPRSTDTAHCPLPWRGAPSTRLAPRGPRGSGPR
jgi:hypothetical protein